MFAWRLADEMNVWLMPALWEVLDGADYYLRHPETLQPESITDDGRQAPGESQLIVDTLSQWQTARLEADRLAPSV